MTCCTWRCVGLTAGVVALLAGTMAFAQPDKKVNPLDSIKEKGKEALKDAEKQVKDAVGVGQPGEMTPEQQAQMEQWMKAATPGEHHKHMEAFVGEWDATMSWWMEPGTTPESSKGTMKNAWVLGGRHLTHHYTGEAMGTPFEGMGTWSYDNINKKYVGTWMDSMSTSVSVTEGSCDAAGKVFTMHGSMTEPSGKVIKQRQVISVNGPDTHTMDFYNVGDDGKEWKSMEIVYTRKAAAANKPATR